MIDPCHFTHYDLITPDGMLTSCERTCPTESKGVLLIRSIDPRFVGFSIDPDHILFNFKSTLAQLGLNACISHLHLDKSARTAEAEILIKARGSIAEEMLDYIQTGSFVGKLFAADERRRVRDPHYLRRMFGRSDRKGRPLLSLGGLQGSGDLLLEKVDGRTIAYLTLQPGCIVYEKSIQGFLPTIGKALTKDLPIRQYLKLHQKEDLHSPRTVQKGQILLVRTLPLHIRTVFGKVVNQLLPKGYTHTNASVLQPDTTNSGDIYELYGEASRELSDIPLEFYTLSPYREHVFFEDRDQLTTSIEDGKALFDAFSAAPTPETMKISTFIAKGEQLLNLQEKDWVVREPLLHDFPGLQQGARQAAMVERYIKQQPSYPFLEAIQDGLITSQGILLTRYFPSPLMKRMLLSNTIQRCIKGMYFQYPSLSQHEFFSFEDRALLHDLHQFAIPVYWLDKNTGTILEYIEREGRDSGMFVPSQEVELYKRATYFGLYGSNLVKGNFEKELSKLLSGLLSLRGKVDHPHMKDNAPLALVTGGGPGVMEVGNKVAMDLGLLSCANIVDFGKAGVVNEQKQNPYVQAKMTYRLDSLVERQAEFHLDYPLFLQGGIGTDFEQTLEEVRRKTGAIEATPIILFGSQEYWSDKITSRFQRNRSSGTIQGSEWISNCFWCTETADQGIKVYKQFFTGKLPIGKNGPIYDRGFALSSSL